MRCTDSKGAGTQKEITEKAKPMKVHLSENAFMGFLLSSAEVFKKESFGYLPDDRFIVEYALYSQHLSKCSYILFVPPGIKIKVK